MATSRLSTRRVEWRVQVGTSNKPGQGLVIFEASVSYIPDPLAAGGPRTAIPEPVAAVLDGSGYACTPDPANPAKAGERGVALFTTDSLGEDGGDWTWTARPQLRSVNGIQMADAVPAFSFAVPAGTGSLDLAEVQKVPASPGLSTEQAVALLAQAKTDVLSLVKRANAGEFKGDQGLPGVNAVPAAEAVATYATTPGNPVHQVLKAAVADGTEKMLVHQPVLNNRPMQAAAQVLSGRLVLGFADNGWIALGWNQYGLAQSENGGAGWIARNVPSQVSENYAAAGKAAAIMFKGNWYLQAIKSTDRLPSIFRAAPVTGAGSFNWSGPLITGAPGSTLFSCALDADEKYIYWGEYGDPAGGPALWRSSNGTSWEKVISSGSGIGRHIHGVSADPYNPGHVYVSGGDTSSTVYNLRSTDYGATWEPMPYFGTDGAWQACQISFDADAIYYAADSITAMGAFKVDRATGKPSWLTRESHRNRDIPGGLPPRKITDLATTVESYKVTSETADFGPEDVGSRLRVRGQNVVPIDTYIRTVDSPTQVTMWQPSRLTASGLTAIFGGESWGAASYYGAVDPRTGIFYFSTLNGAFGGNVDGLFAIYPDGQLILLNILTTSPDARMYVIPERNLLWVQGFSHSLLTI